MAHDTPLQPRHLDESIRQTLERDAWRHHPEFASRQEQRRRREAPGRRLRWQDRVLLITGIVLMLALLVRIQTAQAGEDEWGLQLLADGAVERSLAIDTAMQVEVTGLLARVLVVQTFRNDGPAWAEGIYRFPLPDGAAVDRLYVKVGERVLEGEIQERETAQRVYQQARADGKAAGLVEQERVNQFSTHLANIGPGEDIQVMIGFLVSVDFADGVFSLRLPTTFNRRYASEPQPGLDGPAPRPLLVASTNPDTPDHGLSLEVDLLTDLGLAAIESRYHDIDIQPVPGGYRVTLLGQTQRTDRDFELDWYPDLQAVPEASLLTWDAGDAVYAQLMLVPPASDALLPQPREVIFIIDTSGSMEGASLSQARSALLQGLQELDGRDRFNILQFNSVTSSLFEASVPATPANVQRAREYLARLTANGGTEMAPALHAALAADAVPGLLRQVVFITDGSVGNERELLARIAGELGRARLFTVGIGAAPNSWFMRKAAEIGRGSNTHIGRLDEVAERIGALWQRIRLPAIQDICVDWGMPAEYYPEVIPDLYAGSPLWLIARLPAEPRTVTLCGRLNGQPWSHEVQVRPGQGSDTLATLWARRKIEALQDSLVFGADPRAMQAQVTQVALDYQLLTPHTSLVAVDRTPARLPGEELATGEIPSLLPAGSGARVAGFAPTATGWKAQVALSALVLLVSGWLFFSPGTRSPVVPSHSRNQEPSFES